MHLHICPGKTRHTDVFARFCVHITVHPVLQVRQYLVEDRRPALEAIAQGFRSLDLADHLEHFSGVEMAALSCGDQYMDVDALIRCFELMVENKTQLKPNSVWKPLSGACQRAASGYFWQGLRISCPSQGLASASQWQCKQTKSSHCFVQLPVTCSCHAASHMRFLQAAWLWRCGWVIISHEQMLSRISA